MTVCKETAFLQLVLWVKHISFCSFFEDEARRWLAWNAVYRKLANNMIICQSDCGGTQYASRFMYREEGWARSQLPIYTTNTFRRHTHPTHTHTQYTSSAVWRLQAHKMGSTWRLQNIKEAKPTQVLLIYYYKTSFKTDAPNGPSHQNPQQQRGENVVTQSGRGMLGKSHQSFTSISLTLIRHNKKPL